MQPTLEGIIFTHHKRDLNSSGFDWHQHGALTLKDWRSRNYILGWGRVIHVEFDPRISRLIGPRKAHGLRLLVSTAPDVELRAFHV